MPDEQAEQRMVPDRRVLLTQSRPAQCIEDELGRLDHVGGRAPLHECAADTGILEEFALGIEEIRP